MATAKKHEVAVRKSHDVEVLTDKPDWLKGQGRGGENIGLTDVVLPRVELVQPLSPCKDKKDSAFIHGVEDGNIFNTLTRENYGEGLKFAPVYYRKVFLLFRTRKAGGGFRGTYETAADAEAARQTQDDPSNHEVVECGEHIILVLTPDGPQQAVLAMTRTKLKVSRQLNSLTRMRHPDDTWATIFQLGSVQQKNDKGTFYNYSIKPVGYAPHPVFMQGEKLHAMLQRGAKMKTAYDDAIDVGSPQDDRGM